MDSSYCCLQMIPVSVPREGRAPFLVRRCLSPNDVRRLSLHEKPLDSSGGKPRRLSSTQQGDIPAELQEPLHHVEKDSQSKAQKEAAITLQRFARGTVARWHYRIAVLQEKLRQSNALKEKQLRKIQQRKVQTMKACKAEKEFEEEHRIVRRRLRRVKTIRGHLQKQKVRALEEHHQLKEQCAALTKQNEDCARVLALFIDDVDRGQSYVENMRQENFFLQVELRAYQAILEVFPREDGHPSPCF